MNKSGHTFPNKIMAVLLQALDELMGTNGLHALLNAAGLKQWTSTPPTTNDKQEIDFSQVAALTRTLVDLYGEKGSQSLMRPANKKLFDELWSADPNFEFTQDQEFLTLDRDLRLKRGIRVFSDLLNSISDVDSRVEDHPTGVQFILGRCPYCWGEAGTQTQCLSFIGLLERAIQKVAGDNPFKIEEVDCIRSGDDTCTFTVRFNS